MIRLIPLTPLLPCHFTIPLIADYLAMRFPLSKSRRKPMLSERFNAANLPTVWTIPAANLPPVSTTPAANNGRNIRLLVHLELRKKSLRIFEKIRNGTMWYTQEPGGNWFMNKTWSRKSCDTLPLRFTFVAGEASFIQLHPSGKMHDGTRHIVLWKLHKKFSRGISNTILYTL